MHASTLKIALPLDEAGGFSSHYGAATRFTILEVDVVGRRILRRVTVVPEANKPCSWPTLLRTAGVKLVIAGGMGEGAQARMRAEGLWVLARAEGREPEELVLRWLGERLEIGANLCGSGAGGPGHGTACGCTG